MSSFVQLVIHDQTCRWQDLVERTVSPEYKVRIFTDPIKRAKHVKRMYCMIRCMYPELTAENIDQAFEAYILGWIEPWQLITFARKLQESRMTNNLF